MSSIESISTALSSYTASSAAQVNLINSSSDQYAAVMAALLEGIDAAATVGSSGGSLIAIA